MVWCSQIRLRMTGVSLMKVFNKQPSFHVSSFWTRSSKPIFNKLCNAGLTMFNVHQKTLRCHPLVTQRSILVIDQWGWKPGQRLDCSLAGSELSGLGFYVLILFPDFTCDGVKGLLVAPAVTAEPGNVVQMWHHESSDLLISVCPINTRPVTRWSGGIIHEMKLAASHRSGCLSTTRGTVKWQYWKYLFLAQTL